MERPLERPEVVEITKSVDEAEGIKTIFLNSSIKAKPGQFVMIWIPRLDEKPFAISYSTGNEIGITVAAVGQFSNKLFSMRAGEKVGIRGPYGTPYRLEGKKVVMVGGGYGSASLTMLAEEALQKGIKVKFVLGARTKNRLVYAERLKKLIGNENLIITTDDGSSGMKGYVTQALQQLLQKEKDKIDKVFVCGPDKMMKAAAEIGIAAGVKGEISGERWFKCGGMGLCGHCCVDPIGIRLCVEGPVIDFETAAKITELGEYHRVKSSRKEKIGTH